MYLFKKELLEICEPGYVTVYIFPRNSTKILVSHRGLLERHRARLNVVGRMDLFPPDVQAAMVKAKEWTSDNERWVCGCECRHWTHCTMILEQR